MISNTPTHRALTIYAIWFDIPTAASSRRVLPLDPCSLSAAYFKRSTPKVQPSMTSRRWCSRGSIVFLHADGSWRLRLLADGGSSPVVWELLMQPMSYSMQRKPVIPSIHNGSSTLLIGLRKTAGRRMVVTIGNGAKRTYTHYVLASEDVGTKPPSSRLSPGWNSLGLPVVPRVGCGDPVSTASGTLSGGRPKSWKATSAAGDRSHYQRRAVHGTFYSDLRRWGIILDTHAQLFGIHGSGEAIAVPCGARTLGIQTSAL